jgi:quercetin dioxygenase-like cupin family protein
MKNLTQFIMGVLLATLMVVFLTNTAVAQDPVKVAPEHYKVLLENDRVRVLEYVSKPGDKEAMHSHPANLLYMLSGATVKFTLPDGKTTESQLKAGEVGWREAETHAVENVGNTDAHVLIIELKEPEKK